MQKLWRIPLRWKINECRITCEIRFSSARVSAYLVDSCCFVEPEEIRSGTLLLNIYPHSIYSNIPTCVHPVTWNCPKLLYLFINSRSILWKRYYCYYCDDNKFLNILPNTQQPHYTTNKCYIKTLGYLVIFASSRRRNITTSLLYTQTTRYPGVQFVIQPVKFNVWNGFVFSLR